MQESMNISVKMVQMKLANNKLLTGANMDRLPSPERAGWYSANKINAFISDLRANTGSTNHASK